MHTRTTGILKKNQIYGHHELRHLCEVAQDDRGWEKVRNWFLSHSAIESKKSVSRTGEDGTVAIHMACKSSAPLDIIEMLLNACEDSLEFKDDYGWCPLHYACHYGASEEVIRVLILSCPKVLKEEDSKGRNPLHFAVGNKCKDMPFSASVFTMLTQSGAAKQVDAKGMLPIHYSCAYGTPAEIMKLLIEAYPESLNCSDDSGFTPLHYAMGNCERKESPKTIEILLSKVSNNNNRSNIDFEQEQKHPLLVFADRTKSFREVSKQECENTQKCLQIYLRTKPPASTQFFTALQSLPQWLEDRAVVEPFVQELLNEKISKRFPTAIMILDFYSIVITLVTYIICVIESIDRRAENGTDDSMSMLSLLPLYIAGGYFAAREFIQILSFIHLGLFFSSWFKRATNWIEISLIVQVIFWTAVMEMGALTLDLFQTGTAITLFFLWLNFLNYLRGMIVEFAVFVSGVAHVLQRLGVFLMALLIILIAFMQIFYTLFLASGYCEGFKMDRSHADTCDPEGAEPFRFCTQWDTFLSVYTMLLGEVDEGDFKTSLLATILFIFFVFLVVILLANVLIAIVTDSYSIIRNERAAIVFWSNRLDFIVEMDVISNGPVTRRLKRVFCGNERSSVSHSTEHGSASSIWSHLMELFDKNGPYLQVEVFSMAFVCLNFLRFIAIVIVIPLWVILGLCSVGLFLPPQIRQKIMRQKISRKRSAAVVKSEHQKNEVRNLKVSVSAFQNELSKALERQEEEVKEIKMQMTSLHSDVMSEMQRVKETLETLLELQESRD